MMNIDYNIIIDHFYPGASRLRDILLMHSRMVADMTVAIAKAHPELNADVDTLVTGAMLHDIGIIRCDAAGIECYGTENYICHGTIGAAMLRQWAKDNGITAADVEPFARICERHTGTGLTAKQIKEQSLPLPEIDLIPETLEEQIICYADKFFSKTRPEVKKSYERVIASLEKFGKDGVEKFQQWSDVFGCQ